MSKIEIFSRKATDFKSFAENRKKHHSYVDSYDEAREICRRLNSLLGKKQYEDGLRYEFRKV
jgi:hypothetical protein